MQVLSSPLPPFPCLHHHSRASVRLPLFPRVRRHSLASTHPQKPTNEQWLVRLAMRMCSTRRPVSYGMSPHTSSHGQVPRLGLSRRKRGHTQKQCDGVEEGQIVMMPGEHKTEGFKVQ